MDDPRSRSKRLSDSHGSGETSEQWLRRAQLGDSDGLNRLFDRHRAQLRKWARGRLPPWARTALNTSDLVQETLFNAFRHLRAFEFRGHGALRAYLRRAVDNRIRDEYRRVARRGGHDPVDDQQPGTAPSPLDQVLAREADDRYRAALSRLKDTDRRLIVARLELGYSFEQLALLSGRQRADSARVALHRALVRLAEEMARA